MLDAGRRDTPAALEVECSLLLLAPDGDAMPASGGRKASVRQALGAFDVAQGATGADVLVDDEASELRIVFAHDRVVALELQKYNDTVYDLEVQGDASYIASGIVVSNCRSSSVPVVKSWKELGIDIDDATPSTRASLDGQVPAEQTYGEWIKKQSAARQDQVLGPTRGALLRNGGVAVDMFYTDRGRFLTLKELAERNERAFAKAGVTP
jgi:hypothetical protein